MKPTAIAAALLIGLAGIAQLACSGGGDGQTADTPAAEDPTPVEHVVFGEYVNPEDSLPSIRYFEPGGAGLVSLNNRCPVRKVRLNKKMPPVYVNGRPVGFC